MCESVARTASGSSVSEKGDVKGDSRKTVNDFKFPLEPRVAILETRGEWRDLSPWSECRTTTTYGIGLGSSILATISLCELQKGNNEAGRKAVAL